MPREILVNTKFGGFHLSDEVKALYKEATKHVERAQNFYIDSDVRRDDPVLLKIVKQVGLGNAGGTFCCLGIVEIPDDVPEDGWIIEDYDGSEWVAEKHRTWGVNHREEART
jgi:hypothetical protein